MIKKLFDILAKARIKMSGNDNTNIHRITMNLQNGKLLHNYKNIKNLTIKIL